MWEGRGRSELGLLDHSLFLVIIITLIMMMMMTYLVRAEVIIMFLPVVPAAAPAARGYSTVVAQETEAVHLHEKCRWWNIGDGF